MASAAASSMARKGTSGGSGAASSRCLKVLEELVFDNRSLRSLPLDPVEDNYVRPQVQNACFSKVAPTPVDNPTLVAFSPSALGLLGLDATNEAARPDFADYFAGNKVLPGAEPAAHCYCGHQFGHFSGQLGDGATMYLGEVLNDAGERWELQFKGAGKTPYSRTADGRKVLRSSLREYLCSEAMHALNVPTTRAGTIVTSDTRVIRDIFYSGDAIRERSTIITRIAPTFLRFGSFEIFKHTDPITHRAGPSAGNLELLRTMLNYTLESFYPSIKAAHESAPPEKQYFEMYREIAKRTARLVARWQCVGFCHGVLNTDNMSIVGLTIDYGPFGFMDRFDPDFICNKSDDGGRYTYAKQPEMCRWNVMKLGEAFEPAMGGHDKEEVLSDFDREYELAYLEGMRAKLGLTSAQPGDTDLFKSLFDTMRSTGADFTNTFRVLSLVDATSEPGSEDDLTVLGALTAQLATPDEIAAACKPEHDKDKLMRLAAMAQFDPRLMPQIGLIMAEIKKHEVYEELKSRSPSEKLEADKSSWTRFLASYRARLQLELPEGGSSEDIVQAQADRRRGMNSVNPKYVLRNYMAQEAIAAAERGDFKPVHDLQALLEDPFACGSLDDGVSATSAATSPVSSARVGAGAGAAAAAAAAAAGGGGAGAGAADVGPGSTSSPCSTPIISAVVDKRPPAWSVELKVT